MNATHKGLLRRLEDQLEKERMDESPENCRRTNAIINELNHALAAAKEEQQRSPTWLGHCSGCTDPHSEGTHQMGTIEHPNLPATGSGLTVAQVMEALDNVGRHEGWGLVTVAKGALRKALEAHAEKGGGNLRKDEETTLLTIEEADEACALGVQRWLQDEHAIDLDENAAERLSFNVTDELEKAAQQKREDMPLPSPPDTDKG